MKRSTRNQLILWDDDHNTFDHVQSLLIEVLGHTSEQAEQCSLIVHGNGKCCVKTGSLTELNPRKHLLLEGGLSVTIK